MTTSDCCATVAEAAACGARARLGLHSRSAAPPRRSRATRHAPAQQAWPLRRASGGRTTSGQDRPWEQTARLCPGLCPGCVASECAMTVVGPNETCLDPSRVTLMLLLTNVPTRPRVQVGRRTDQTACSALASRRWAPHLPARRETRETLEIQTKTPTRHPRRHFAPVRRKLRSMMKALEGLALRRAGEGGSWLS